jgi:hypothetical protein
MAVIRAAMLANYHWIAARGSCGPEDEDPAGAGAAEVDRAVVVDELDEGCGGGGCGGRVSDGAADGLAMGPWPAADTKLLGLAGRRRL